ncbi:MAG: hypothetical protein WC483_05300 [Candidatus Paceibacterota bacterium]
MKGMSACSILSGKGSGAGKFVAPIHRARGDPLADTGATEECCSEAPP